MKTPFGRSLLAVAVGVFAFSCTDTGPTQTEVGRTLPVNDPLFAYNGTGACMDDDNDAFGGGGPINCTSNDIRIARTIVNSVNGNIFDPDADELLCTPGQNLQLGLTLVLQETANSDREDVGIWVSADGDSEAHFGSCHHFSIDKNAAGAFNPDGDECAGIEEGADFDLPLTGTTVLAVCPAAGSEILIGGCVAWKVPGSLNTQCPADPAPANDPTDGYRASTLPANPAKCNCEPFSIPIVLAGSITIVKDAVPNNAQNFAYTATGEGVSAFTLDDDAGAPGADATFSNTKLFTPLNPTTGNPRVITETVPSGWLVTNIVCSGGTFLIGSDGDFDEGDLSVSVTVSSGSSTTCTFTNTMQASLDIEKVSLGGIGTFDYVGTGTGVTASFTRQTTTAGVQTVTAPLALNGANAAGDKYVQESAEAGFTLTNISCTADGATVVIGRGGSGAFVDGGSAGFEQGDNTVKVTLAPGSDPQCVFTNTADGAIDIEKISIGGISTFDYVETGPCYGANFSRTTTTAGVATATAPTACAAPFTDQYVQETVPSGWSLTNISCSGGTFVIGSGGSGAFVNGGGDGFNAGDNTVKITPTAGVTTSCTFENTKSASLDIEKISLGGIGTFDYVGAGAGVSASFSRTTTTAGVSTATDPFAISVANLGTKYVQETPVPTGWTLTGISCTAGGATFVIGRGGSAAFVNGGTDGFDAGDNTVQVNVVAGSTPSCTFTNTKIATVDIEKISVGGIGTFPMVETGNCFDGLSRTTTTAGVSTATAASECAVPYPSDQFVQETAPAGWALTGISCSGTATIVIGSGGSGAFVAGTTTGFDAGDNTVKITNGAGTTALCTFTNTKLATLRIEKQTLPDGDATSFQFTPGGYNSNTPFNLSDGQTNTASNLTPNTTYTATETVPAGWALTGRVCTLTGGGAKTHTTPSTGISVNLLPGEDVTCVFTNTKQGKVQVIKTVNGSPITGSETFTFTLRTGATALLSGTTLETIVANSTNGGTLNFTTFLVPGDSYQICEVVFVGWNSSIETLPGAFVVQPDAEADNSTRCAPFTATPGQTVVINIDNVPPPGGDARTIGYWKNWSSCTGGKQAPVLDQTLASFPIAVGQTTHGVLLGDLYVDTCAEAFATLNKSTLAGKKSASDPAYNMAAQLLAAILNIQAGAGTCAAANTAIADGLALLDAINFNGTGSFKNATGIGGANAIAGLLDSYNNNNLCGP